MTRHSVIRSAKSAAQSRSRSRSERQRCALALLAATAIGLATPAQAQDSAGPAQLPAIELRADPAHGSDLGFFTDKPMVLNVWATWCPPCRREMPALQSLGDQLAAHGVRVVVLSVDEDVNLMKEFLIKYRITLPAPVAASASEVYRKLDAIALPVTYYVERGGRIAGRHLGAREWAEPEVVREVLERIGPKLETARGERPARPAD